MMLFICAGYFGSDLEPLNRVRIYSKVYSFAGIVYPGGSRVRDNIVYVPDQVEHDDFTFIGRRKSKLAKSRLPTMV